MNRRRFVFLGSILAAVAVTGWAWGGIEGSKHDFSNSAWSSDDTCGACHSPHRSTPPKAAPLWDPNADLSKRFGTRADRKVAPGSGTMMCLRCHDGTIAKEAIAGVKKRRITHSQHPGLFSAGHETTDHPVGIVYPQFDKGFRPATTVTAKGVALPDGKVECISCHDPHNQADQRKMLVSSNRRSALCLTCHKK